MPDHFHLALWPLNNLVLRCDLMKAGEPGGGWPRGDRVTLHVIVDLVEQVLASLVRRQMYAILEEFALAVLAEVVQANAEIPRRLASLLGWKA